MGLESSGSGDLRTRRQLVLALGLFSSDFSVSENTEHKFLFFQLPLFFFLKKKTGTHLIIHNGFHYGMFGHVYNVF